MPTYLATDGYARKGADQIVPGRLVYDGLGYRFERDGVAPPPGQPTIYATTDLFVVTNLSAAEALFDTTAVTAVTGLTTGEALTASGGVTAVSTPTLAEALFDSGTVEVVSSLTSDHAFFDSGTVTAVTTLSGAEALFEVGLVNSVVTISDDRLIVLRIMYENMMRWPVAFASAAAHPLGAVAGIRWPANPTDITNPTTITSDIADDLVSAEDSPRWVVVLLDEEVP